MYDDIYSHLIDSALSFFGRASSELWDDSNSENNQLKFSTIHFHEGVELIFKARLMKEHWSLIVRDISRLKSGGFEDGEFASIGFDEIADRLSSVAGVEIPDEAVTSFREVRKLRNKYVHFHCNATKVEVISKQLSAWHHLPRLMEETPELLVLSYGEKSRLQEIKLEMLKSEEFLDLRFKNVQEELNEVRDVYRIITCPFCSRSAMYLKDGRPRCLVCGTDYYPSDVANKWAVQNIGGWKHPKHGIDDQEGYCLECGGNTIVPVDDPEFEDNEGELFCFGCHQSFDRTDALKCSYCGEELYGMNREKGGLCPACNHWV